MALVLLAVLAHGVFTLAGVWDTLAVARIPVGVVCLGLPLVAIRRRSTPAIHVSLVLALMAAWRLAALPGAWPLYLAGPLAVYAVFVVAVVPLRSSVTWIRRGMISTTTIVLMGLCVGLSSAALAIWFYWADPDVAAITRQIPDVSWPLLALICVVFAVVNATLEETVWRGIMMDALLNTRLSISAVIAVQAASFGVFHIGGGIPRGVLGVAMALCFGAMLGIVRRQSRGMLAPFLTHVIADVTIFALIMVPR